MMVSVFVLNRIKREWLWRCGVVRPGSQEGLTGEMASELRAKEIEGTSHAEIRRKCIPGRRNNYCKCPEVGRS